MSDPQEAGHSPVPAATAPGQGTAASGPGRPRGRLPLTGNAIIQAVTEGHSAVITILAVFAALVIGGLLIVASDPVVLRAWDSFGYAPLAALSATWTSVSAAYSALFEGSIFSPATISAAFHGGSIAAIFYPLSLTAFEATPLILTGLSVAVAFRAGMFNIGAAGQWIGGALVATWLGYAVSLPIVLHAAVCVIGAFAGGAVIGWIVGEIKARTGAHEVILTIMLNYVALQIVQVSLRTDFMRPPTGSEPISKVIDFIRVPALLPLPGLRLHWGFVVALVAAVLVSYFLFRTTKGFELRSAGLAPGDVESATLGVAAPTVHTIGEAIEVKRAPRTGYMAQFSGPYAVAAGLLGGAGLGVGLADFTDELAVEPARRALMARVDVVADDRCSEVFPHQFPAVLRVRTKDSRELVAEVMANRGGPGWPLSYEELATKFRDNAGRLLDAATVTATERAVADLDHARSLDDLLEPLGQLPDRPAHG